MEKQCAKKKKKKEKEKKVTTHIGKGPLNRLFSISVNVNNSAQTEPENALEFCVKLAPLPWNHSQIAETTIRVISRYQLHYE